MSECVVHRVQLPLADSQTVILPGFVMHRALHVEAARDGTPDIELWYTAYANALDEQMRVAVHVVGTGHPFDFHGDHVGTVLMGQFVWHVFVEYPIVGEQQ